MLGCVHTTNELNRFWQCQPPIISATREIIWFLHFNCFADEITNEFEEYELLIKKKIFDFCLMKRKKKKWQKENYQKFNDHSIQQNWFKNVSFPWKKIHQLYVHVCMSSSSKCETSSNRNVKVNIETSPHLTNVLHVLSGLSTFNLLPLRDSIFSMCF